MGRSDHKLKLFVIFTITAAIGYACAAIFNWRTEGEVHSRQQEGMTAQFGESKDADWEDVRFFPETGHWINGIFLGKYINSLDPSEIYGKPITEVFVDKNSGSQVQYFEKSRFEADINEFGEEFVNITKLGSYFYHPGPSLEPPAISGCKYFQGSEYPVCYDFLAYFEKYGAIEQFGVPISGFETHDGWIVQYFENSRFEWRPDLEENGMVYVSNLGYDYFFAIEEDTTMLYAEIQEAIPVTQFDLHITIDVLFPINQVVNNVDILVIVQDQYLNPIQDALLVYQVIYPNGSSEMYYPGVTDAAGSNLSSLELLNGTCGQSKIIVAVGVGEIMKEQQAHFYIRCP